MRETKDGPAFTYKPYVAPSPSVHPLRPYAAVNSGSSHYETAFDDFDDGDLDNRAAARELLNYGVAKYFSSALVSPFQVAATLLQVQYLPTDSHLESPGNVEEEYSRDTRRLNQFESFTSDEDSEIDIRVPYTPKSPVSVPSQISFLGDHDDYGCPAYRIPPLENGVWDAVGAIGNHAREGWSSLWKGQYTNWIFQMTQLFLQPTLEGVLNDLFDLYDDTIPLVHLDNVAPNLATLVVSHVVVGWVLSPLELVRTRLVVQTSSPEHRKYSGFYNCLRTTIAEEGLRQIYLHPTHLVPTLLHHALLPLLANTRALVIDRMFGISATDSPFIHALAALGLSTAELIITLPLETVRKRLQIQQIAQDANTSGASVKPFVGCVSLRKRPYTGWIDCMYRIITEEGGRRRKRKSRRTRTGGSGPSGRRRSSVRRQSSSSLFDSQDDFRPTWWNSWGLGGLYKGMGVHLTANSVLFLINAVNGIQEEEDW